MQTKTIALVAVSPQGLTVAETIRRAYPEVRTFSIHAAEGVERIEQIQPFVAEHFTEFDAWIFIGALGICVRSIGPLIGHKYTDPAIINIDSTARHVVSVLSGHVGGANELTRDLAALLGAEPVISTQTDNTGLWALDLFSRRYGWVTKAGSEGLNRPIALYTNREKTALLLEVQDRGTSELERTKAEHVDVYYSREELMAHLSEYAVLLVVSYRALETDLLPTVHFIPPVLSLGLGCRYQCDPKDIVDYILGEVHRFGFFPEAIHRLATIDLKKDEPLLHELAATLHLTPEIYTAADLADVEVANPSKKVHEVTGVWGVAESTARYAASLGSLVLEKQKGMLHNGNDFTFALAVERSAERRARSHGTQLGGYEPRGAVCTDEGVLRQRSARGTPAHR